MSTEPTDVREMRKMIYGASYGRDRIDGEPLRGRISLVGSTINVVLKMAERDGWSGEDTMTALAFYALRNWESCTDREIERINLEVQPRYLGAAS